MIEDNYLIEILNLSLSVHKRRSEDNLGHSFSFSILFETGSLLFACCICQTSWTKSSRILLSPPPIRPKSTGIMDLFYCGLIAFYCGL